MSFSWILALFLLSFSCDGLIISSRNFVVTISSQSYTTGQSYCDSDFGTKLASINSQQDQNEITELRQSSTVASNNLYIGLSDNGGTSFTWEDSSSLSYTNWCTGPVHGSGAYCAIITSSGCWSAVPCTQSLYFICNRPNLIESTNYVVPVGANLYYDDARTFCQMTVGTDLASVTNIAEQNELRTLVNQADNNDYFFLGLNDVDTEATFVWTDGTSYDSTFTNSRTCNANGVYEDCIVLDSNNGCWVHEDCHTFWFFACNRPRITTTANYVAVDGQLSFVNANSYCLEEYGSTLATISSSSENVEVSSNSYKTSWIGYNDINTENQFTWLSGSSTYTNWRTSTNEPNNFQNEDCTIIYKSSNPCPGCWNDIDCLDPRAFVCNN